jgi:hypothetical protein
MSARKISYTFKLQENDNGIINLFIYIFTSSNWYEPSYEGWDALAQLPFRRHIRALQPLRT